MGQQESTYDDGVENIKDWMETKMKEKEKAIEEREEKLRRGATG